MSSDSAFQSLGDGLELEDEKTSSVASRPVSEKLETSKLQMKAIAEEAKKLRLRKNNDDSPTHLSLSEKIKKFSAPSKETSNLLKRDVPKRRRAQFQTQPVTPAEVETARFTESYLSAPPASDEQDESSRSNLSLSEKIKMFNTSTNESSLLKRDVPRRRRTQFQTQPITPAEVETARSTESFLTTPSGPDSDSNTSATTERKGILKSKLAHSRSPKSPTPPRPRSVLKKKVEPAKSTDDSLFLNPKSILKPETVDFTYDEGISSDDSSSDVDASGRAKCEKENSSSVGKNNISARLAAINVERLQEASSKSCSDSHTSDESSGGREIQSIIGREAAAAIRARNKHLNEGLSKSRSHAEVGNEFQNQATGVHRSMTHAAMPRTIGQLQAKLQQSGDSDWRKRISKLNNSGEELTLLKAKNLYNEELSEKSSILSAKIDELDAASQKWKNRVEKNDAVNFSVAGRMQEEEKTTISLSISSGDKNRTPKAKRFKGKEGDNEKDSATSPSSRISADSTGSLGFKRSISVPGSGTTNDSSGSETTLRSSGRRVKVLKPDDDNFKNFFRTSEDYRAAEETLLDLRVEDFDVVTRETHQLLVQKRTTKAQKRRVASKNPVKALASRSDIVEEYEEFLTGFADREIKRLNVEKLAKSSSFALEALAGLASKEDFSSILLKKCASPRVSLLPYKDLMLIHVKGRRHVQARLVEPAPSSINEGDNYVLVTPNALYNYVGQYCNIIEQTRACDIINYIQQSGDMGCKAEKVVTVGAKNSSSSEFWNCLGTSSEDVSVTEAGHPDEDEVYEASILRTNMIYGVENNELVPVDEYWGKIPKIQMLSPSKVYVFDFGTEMYVWSGTTAAAEEKKVALKLAKDLWSDGYNYTDCNVNPMTIAEMLGGHKKVTGSLKATERPDWALFAKVTQHTETILFREKFLDWPNYSRLIKNKITTNNNKSDSSITINSCDAKEMRHRDFEEPDFQVEGSHLGRGHSYFDEETKRQSEITTLGVTCWHILENAFEEVPPGHFYDADTYVVRWQYRVTITGRKLTGKPSNHNQTGRDRCVYFCWLGNNASVNEKGTAALLTVELDSENARQIRVTQGLEPTAFIRLFEGKMIVHNGRSDKDSTDTSRLYIVRGEIQEETALLQVPCSMRSLRSRSSFVFVEPNTVVAWNGCKCSEQSKEAAKKFADYISETKSKHFGLFGDGDVKVAVIEEGQEDDDFLEALGEKRQLYLSLVGSTCEYDYTPRLFHFSSVSGGFKATEVLCSHRSEFVTSYPFLQSHLYSANQPALFLLDNNHEIWLWQGWWPERKDDLDLSDQVGSAVVRWQAERRAAMQTAIDYWRHVNAESRHVPAYLVWAGLEPLEFTNLFPIWEDRDDIAELNIKEGRKAGGTTLVKDELAQLTRTTYPLSQLLQRPLPEGVDPTHLEIYLSPDEFVELLSMTKSDFQKLPTWKQTAIKKEKGLF